MSITAPFYRMLDNPIGADFVLTANLSGVATFPISTTARIEVYGPDRTTVLKTWNGTYSTTAFSWIVDKTDKADLPASAHYRMYVVFPDEPKDWLWYFGEFTTVG